MRTNRSRWIIGVALALAAPCAFAWGLSRAVWVHPTKQEGEFQRDYNECQQKAAQNAANWGMKGNIFSIASDTNQCLVDKGWQKVKESELRALQQSPIYFIEWETKLGAVLRTNRGDTAPAVPLPSNDGGTFADEFVEVVGSLPVHGNEANVEVANKTDASARIVWDEASYVDKGVANRVTHSGVEFADRSKPQLPTIIAGRSRVKQVVMPSDAIAQLRGRWIHVPLFPLEETFDQTSGRAVLAPGMTPEIVDTRVASRLVGKELRVLLPIEIGGVLREYTLVFTVTGTKVRATSQTELETTTVFTRTAL
jgi:hypothetical protein